MTTTDAPAPATPATPDVLAAARDTLRGMSSVQRDALKAVASCETAMRWFSRPTRQALTDRGLVEQPWRAVWQLTELGVRVLDMLQSRALLEKLEARARESWPNGEVPPVVAEKLAELRTRAGR